MNVVRYETDAFGVTLAVVRVRRDTFFVDGRMKVQKGAVGMVASDDRGHLGVAFDRPENDGIYVAKDGGGRRTQIVHALDVEYAMAEGKWERANASERDEGQA